MNRARASHRISFLGVFLFSVLVYCTCPLGAQESNGDLFWQQLPGGLDWQIAGISGILDKPSVPPASQPSGKSPSPTVRVRLRNRTDEPIQVPADFYRTRSNGGPALAEGLSIHLERAAFNARTPDQEYPRDADYAVLTPIRDDHFSNDGKRRMLAPHQTLPVFELDLKDWFPVKQPGYYRFNFDFDFKALKLGDDPAAKPDFVAVSAFVIGNPPPKLSVAELNRTIEPLGGKGEFERLRALIETELPAVPTIQPSTRPVLPPALAAIDTIRPASGADGNGPPDPTEISLRDAASFKRVDSLSAYDPLSVRRELEARLKLSDDRIAQLYVAAIAARYGSRAGALHLLESTRATDETSVRNTQEALAIALREFEHKPPNWLISLVIAELSDQRYMTEAPSYQVPPTIAHVADEGADLTSRLGWAKAVSAVPKLIELARPRGESRNAIWALGEIGDPRSVPVLVDVLKSREAEIKIWSGTLSPDSLDAAVVALGRMKVREAVPFLLRHVCHQDVIEALEEIGDSSALPDLKKVVATGKPQQIEGSNDETDRDARDAARVAVATLENRDPIPAYITLLADQSLNQYARRGIVWRFGNHPERREITPLLAAIKNDPSGAVVNQAVTVLSVFKYKSSVEGLIGCLDANFEGKHDWKRAYRPEMFRENIAKSLQEITGEHFGPDRQQWSNWWEKTGRFRMDLK